jgi:hypothetical protein
MRLTVHTTIDAKRLEKMKITSPELVDKAVQETARRVERLAKTNIRELGLVDTGRLRASVHVQKEGDTYTYTAKSASGGEPSAFDGTIDVTIGRFEAVVGTNVEYAAVHEYGGKIEVREHQRRISKKGQEGKVTVKVKSHIRNVKARPYLTPAYNKVRSEGYLTKRVRYWMNKREP